MKYLLILIIGIVTNLSFSQKYLVPPVISQDGAKLTVTDMVKAGEAYKFKLIIENTTSDKYYAYSIKQTIFDFPGSGKVAPDGRDKLIIVGPNDKKSTVIDVRVPEQSYFPNFKLQLNGLYQGNIPSSPVSEDMVTFAVGKTETLNYGNMQVEVSKVSAKKGVVTIATKIDLNGTLSNPSELLIYNPEELSFESSKVDNAGSAYAEYPGGKKRLNIKVISGLDQIPCAFGKAFKIVPITNTSVASINISDGSTPPPANDVGFSVGNGCGSHTANTSGPTKVNVSSEVGCFEFFVMGQKLTPQAVSTLQFNADINGKKVKAVLAGGIVIEKTMLTGEGYSAVYFIIKKKKNGKYTISQNLMAAETAQQPQSNTNSRPSGSYDDDYYDRCRMDNGAFYRLKNAIEEESFEDNKLRLAKQAGQNKCMSVYQVKEIAKLFSFSKQQLEFTKAAYGNCLNRSDYYEVLEIFTFSKDKQELENYMNNY